jgi:hypothetical protein
MRVFWERIGVLGPVYRLVGQGRSDHDIANQLHLTKSTSSAVSPWILHFLQFTSRSELVQYAATAAGQLSLGALSSRPEPVLN